MENKDMTRRLTVKGTGNLEFKPDWVEIEIKIDQQAADEIKGNERNLKMRAIILDDKLKPEDFDDLNGLLITRYDEEGNLVREIKDYNLLKGITDRKLRDIIEALIPEGNGSITTRAAAYTCLRRYVQNLGASTNMTCYNKFGKQV